VNALVDRITFLKKSDLSSQQLNKIRDDLVLKYSDDYGSKTLVLYEETKTRIGIPRHYAEKIQEDFNINLCDCTNYIKVNNFPKMALPPRDYQKPVLETMLSRINNIDSCRYGGILSASVGTGKTYMSLYIASKLKTKTLVLVHKSDLFGQWQEAIKQFMPSAKVGVVRQNKLDFAGNDIVIGMYQSILSRKDYLESKGFFNYFGLVIIEELHRISADSYEQTIRLLNSRYRLGISGTLKRRDGMEACFYYHIGPILSEIAQTRLQGSYYQIPIQSNVTLKKMRGGRLNNGRLLTDLTQDPIRNMVILNHLISAYKQGRKCLVFTERVDHAKYLVEAVSERLSKEGIMSDVALYLGGMKKEQLESAKTSKMVIGTGRIMAEGTDFPDADTAFITVPMGNVIQLCGRILREFKGKKSPLVVDFVDSMSYCKALARKREKNYQELNMVKK
jgi:superfamily II DNA or RNA helicase